jgi:hypothetical protein
MAALVDALDTKGWNRERDAIVRRFLQMSAAEFVEAFTRGDFDGVDNPDVMSVLALFPELD